jgi:hypothetical protein
MKITNSGEYVVNVFGVILPSGDGLDGAECETMLRAHPELANSIGRNGLTVDAEAAKILGIKASPVPQPEESAPPAPAKK